MTVGRGWHRSSVTGAKPRWFARVTVHARPVCVMRKLYLCAGLPAQLRTPETVKPTLTDTQPTHACHFHELSVALIWCLLRCLSVRFGTVVRSAVEFGVDSFVSWRVFTSPPRRRGCQEQLSVSFVLTPGWAKQDMCKPGMRLDRTRSSGA